MRVQELMLAARRELLESGRAGSAFAALYRAWRARLIAIQLHMPTAYLAQDLADAALEGLSGDVLAYDPTLSSAETYLRRLANQRQSRDLSNYFDLTPKADVRRRDRCVLSAVARHTAVHGAEPEHTTVSDQLQLPADEVMEARTRPIRAKDCDEALAAISDVEPLSETLERRMDLRRKALNAQWSDLSRKHKRAIGYEADKVGVPDREYLRYVVENHLLDL
ncbi:MAG: hypothetical protein ACOYBP_09110 [Microbacteriaceae bacterium]